MKKAIALTLLLVTLFTISACGNEQNDEAQNNDAVLVTINGTDYTQGEFDEYFNLFCAVNQLENSQENKDYYVQAGLLDEFIFQQLILQEAEKKDMLISLDEASEIMTEDIINYYGSVDTYKELYLDSIDISWDELVRFYRVGLIYDKLIEDRLSKEDIDLEAIYNENPERYQMPEQVEASHILVEDLDTAKDLIAQLDEGADFAALAEEYSIDTASAINGGYLGYFSAEDMVEEFSKEAFSLPVGTYSHEPVQSQFGYHIIYVTDHTQAKQLSFEEAQSYIVQDVSYDIEEDIYTELISQAQIVYAE